MGQTETHDVGNPVDAVLWRDGKLLKLGRFGAAASTAIAINRRGHILIDLLNRGGDSQGGVLLAGSTQLKIKALGGAPPPNQDGPLNPLRLNDLDQVVGYGYTVSGARRSFVWQNGKTTLLPTFDTTQPPWGAPSAINNNGGLTGTSYVNDLLTIRPHIVVWTPKR